MENQKSWPTGKQELQARTLTQPSDRWPAGSHQHWHTCPSLSPSAIYLYIWLYLRHLFHQKHHLIWPHSQIYGIYFSFCSNAPIPSLDLTVFRIPLSVFIKIVSTLVEFSVVPDHKTLQFTKQTNCPASFLLP